MSVPREVARLAIGTLSSAIDLVRGAVWISIGLILLAAVAGAIFAPVWSHLAKYWWVYLFVAATVALLFALLVTAPLRGASEPPDPRPDQPETFQPLEVGARPTSGRALFRYTDEWLTREGLFAGGRIAKAEAVRIAGRTAIAYHLTEGNFVEHDGEVFLTPKGHAHFTNRRSRI